MSSPFDAPTMVLAAPNPDKDRRIARASQYPHYMWFIIASFIGFLTLCRLISIVFSKLPRNRPSQEASDPEKRTNRRNNRNVRFSNLPQALVNLYRILAFRLTINIGTFSVNLTEVTVCVLYIVALFTLLLINDTNAKGVPFDISYWSNRAGTLLASQFPLITVLGTKNNVVSLLTGIGYEKLNVVHRMLARTLFVLLCVHAAGRIYSGLEEDIHETWLHTGWMAALAFCVLFIISLRPVRGKAYEFFFYTHMALALIILGGAYYHTSTFVDGKDTFGHYLWPCFLIWGLDRVIRAIRLVAFNHSYFGFGSGSGTLDATTELLTPHLVRITLKRPPHFHWAPGQFAYLITPGVSSLPFEGHPFTIASYDSTLNAKEIAPGTEKSSESPKSYWKELVFLVNVREGFTKRLGHVAAQKGTIKVFVDGPYGQRNDLSGFDSVVLIAGGTGVTYTLPMLLDVVEGVRSGRRTCSRVIFVWTVRDSRHFKWALDVINSAVKLAPSSLTVEIHLFVTGSSNTDWDTVSTDSKLESPGGVSTLSAGGSTPPPSPFEIPGLKVSLGRPSLDGILKSETEEARGGSMCVAVCGSESIAGTVRRTLGFSVAGPTSIMRGSASITLLVESFGYA
ncbi:hypothetical protein K435DRAFT_220812 [Dendrothele bispora CBS 962.96]|uniref:ferric-chelate reductase (NADPH) n=1 Tax=Dendrothele bispora (strain CBS 962.96) TaxID=1314807 RepID=A0A4S8MMF0_DENBC|nr:hypothetical protein K435DRAFT_220812 [Dendrothele bispora CBS 962.96]